MKKVLGLIGKPLDHSLSPIMHNWLIGREGLNYTYLSFEVEKGNVMDALKGAQALDFRGLNVTIPHKLAAAKAVDVLGERSRMLGAVNTIDFSDSSIKGKNTDLTGFLRSLDINGFLPSDKNCFVFGAGGGSAAVCFGLAKARARKVTIANRTFSKAEELKRKVNKCFQGQPKLEALSLDENLERYIEEADIVINTTPVGTWPRVDEAIWNRSSVFSGDQVVYDLVYNPPRTKFLEIADEGGARIISGLDMLICQGVESLSIWTGKDFILENFLPELREHLKENLS